MADFVAVIRRAVDSLPSNTPEMRAKVYDKARAAVRRQLENMKPAPPEEMLRRQMDKLEEAILSVDAEHAEALPAEALAGEEEVFRSEEHTSELQSLMRISYAVFCLKKKKTYTPQHRTQPQHREQ